MHLEMDGVEDGSLQRSGSRPANVASATFPLIRRGYDPTQVQWYLQSLAEDLADHEEKSVQLQAKVDHLEEQLTKVARIDEGAVANFLGEESARLFTMARDTSEQLVKRAENRAGDIVTTAKTQAADLRATTETESKAQRQTATEETDRLRLETHEDIAKERREAGAACRQLRHTTEADTAEMRRAAEVETAELRQAAESETAELRQTTEADTDLLRRTVTAETAKLRQAAEAEAGSLRRAAEADTTALRQETDAAVNALQKQAEEACRESVSSAQDKANTMIAEAEQTRRDILSDLARRRSVATTQLRQLMDGRDALLASLTHIATTSAGLQSGLEDFTMSSVPFVDLREETMDDVVQVDDAAVAIYHNGEVAVLDDRRNAKDDVDDADRRGSSNPRQRPSLRRVIRPADDVVDA